MRIGVVDTGVDPTHPVFDGQVVQGIGVKRVGGGYQYDVDLHDLSGHGTAMAVRIHSFCKTAEICAVRIAQQEEGGVAVRVEERALAMGVEWCVDEGIHIVNVSYSIAEAEDGGFLARACAKAHEKGVIVVAAYRNGEAKPVYPAAFPTVIGVRSLPNSEPGQISVLCEENHDLRAFGGSNSMACAQVSAMVGRIHTVDDSLGLDDVFGYLMQVAIP